MMGIYPLVEYVLNVEVKIFGMMRHGLDVTTADGVTHNE